MPVGVEELVREIVPVQALDGLEPLGNLRIGAEIKGVRIDHALGKVERLVDARRHALRLARGQIDMQRHEVPQRHRRAPARRRVVAHIEDAADRELAPGDIDDHAPVLVRDPAPDAVQRNDVEFRQVVALRELLERRVEDVDVGARTPPPARARSPPASD